MILEAGRRMPVDGLLWPLRGISQDVLSIPLYSDAAESHFEMLTPLDRAADYEGGRGPGSSGRFDPSPWVVCSPPEAGLPTVWGVLLRLNLNSAQYEPCHIGWGGR